MEVQVLGTKFNIKAYTDDQAIFTTLVSGSVQIKERESAHTALLRPDEQCIYTTTMAGCGFIRSTRKFL